MEICVHKGKDREELTIHLSSMLNGTETLRTLMGIRKGIRCVSRSRLKAWGAETNGKTRANSKVHVLGNMPIQQNYPQRIHQIKIRTQTGMSTKDPTEEETTRYYRLLGNKLKARHVIKTSVTG
jgi:hypothetical protein